MTAVRPTILLVMTAALIVSSATAQTSSSAQSSSAQTGKTVRKHRVVDDRSGTIIVRAENAIDKRDFATAEQLLKEAVADDPQDFRAWFDLGFVYNAQGQKDQAIAAYRKSVAADPKVFESNLNLGLSLAQAHDPEAEKYLRAATQLKPTAKPDEGRARAWLGLGHLLEASDYTAALNAFAEAARLQPKDPEPHLSAATLLERQSKPAEAEKEYRLAAEADPKSADAVLGLANLYMKSDRLPEAETALRQYVALDPQYAAAHFELGRVLMAEHKRFDAIDSFETGLKLAPNDLSAQRDLAGLYDMASKFDKADAMYRTLLQANPKDAATHAALGSTLLHERKPAEAEQELLTAVQLDPELGDAYGDLALAASSNQHYELAIRALDARAKIVVETPGTYFLRATAYDHLHLPKQAAANYRQFLQVANGRYPDQEWQARHRLIAIDPEKNK